MGMNTVVVLFNDMTQRWPSEIANAMHEHNYPCGDGSHFGYGKVISIAHADFKQLIWAGWNDGKAVFPDTKDIPAEVLFRMADILNANGYKVTKRRTKI
jgi:hypothetical protein